MKKKALILLDGIETDEEIGELRGKLSLALDSMELKVRLYNGEESLEEEDRNFFNRSSSPEDLHGGAAPEGWYGIKENEKHMFFILFVELEFDRENYRLDNLWKERAENYLFDPALGDSGMWRRFCGNELSNKRIFIAPVKKDNLKIIKSIFSIFLNKQIDDIRLHTYSDVKLRYYLTAQELPYTSGDSSERLVPACSNIYKLAESLDRDRLYISRDVMDFMPENIRNNLTDVEGEGNLYSYSFNLLT